MRVEPGLVRHTAVLVLSPTGKGHQDDTLAPGLFPDALAVSWRRAGKVPTPTSVESRSDKLTLLPVARWARRRDVGTVLISHERLDDMFAMRVGGRTGLDTSAKASIKLLNRILVRSFDAIVVTSLYAEAEFRTVADSAGCPIRRVPLGVDLDTFRPHPTPPADGVLKLAHVGRLSREKSPHLAVATAVELHRRGVPVSMEGAPACRAPPRRAVDLAAGAPVHFRGFVEGRDELSRAIAAADVSLSVCPGETFGLAVLEALASGTPVVTADRGGARELVDATSGAWNNPEPSALADAVLDVAGRPERLRRAGARRRAEQFPGL